MQNSGLGVALASAHFGPLAALPSALAAVWHNVSGPILATVRSKKSATVINTTKDETVAVVPLSSSTKG